MQITRRQASKVVKRIRLAYEDSCSARAHDNAIAALDSIPGLSVDKPGKYKWTYTTLVADTVLATQDGRRVEVQVGPPGSESWTEAAPVEIIEGRRMRIETEI